MPAAPPRGFAAPSPFTCAEARCAAGTPLRGDDGRCISVALAAQQRLISLMGEVTGGLSIRVVRKDK